MRGMAGKKHTEESKKKISEAKKANPTKFWLGKVRSQETKDRISKTKTGVSVKQPPLSAERKERLRKLGLGRIPSLETRLKLSFAQKGEKGSNWQGGIWSKNRTEYQKYKGDFRWGIWRKEVFERDKYTCQDCGIKGNQTGGYLEPHHIIPIREIVNNNQLDLIYEVSNGLTLCRKCHMKTFKRK